MRVSRFENELRWLHKVRLYPTCAQARELFVMLRTTRELYNAMLEQRRDAWKTRQLKIASKQQYAEITELRAAEPGFAAVYRRVRRRDVAPLGSGDGGVLSPPQTPRNARLSALQICRTLEPKRVPAWRSRAPTGRKPNSRCRADREALAARRVRRRDEP
jgi:putative transposase